MYATRPVETPSLTTSQVRIVPRILHVQNYKTNILYTVDDGTGVLDARYWHPRHSDLTHYNDAVARNRTESFDDFVGLQLLSVFFRYSHPLPDWRSPNTFASITGTIDCFGTRKHIDISHIEHVVDVRDMCLHQMSVVIDDLSFHRSSAQTPSCVPCVFREESPSSFSAVQPTSRSHVHPLARAIIQVMQEAPVSTNGPQVSDIVQAVRGDRLTIR
jgi:hypothetical protein